MNNKTINIWSDQHLGDNIFNCILFYNIKNYIEENNITIHYYFYKEYYEQVSEFNCSENIHLLEYKEGDEKSKDLGIRLWIANTNFNINFYNRGENPNYDILYVNFFNEFLQKVNIPITLSKLEYEDTELLTRYDNIHLKYNSKYSNLDFLICNSTPRSGQYEKKEEDWNKLIHKLNKTYKIVTTEKVEGVHCTCDDKLSIKDIAAISTKTKKIIIVNSGVIVGLFNTYTLNNVEAIYYFDNIQTYEHPKFIKPPNNDINELYKILNIDTIESFDTIDNSTISINFLVLFIIFITLLLIFLFYNNKWYKKIKKYIIPNGISRIQR